MKSAEFKWARSRFARITWDRPHGTVAATCEINYINQLKFCNVFNLKLPDLRYLDCRVDFSIKTFGSVVNLCKDLGIRYPEELSLCKPLEAAHLKRNYSEYPKKKIPVEQNGNSREYISPAPDTNSFIPSYSSGLHGSVGSLDGPNGPFSCAPVQHTPHKHLQSTPISSPTGVSTFLTMFFFCIFINNWFQQS